MYILYEHICKCELTALQCVVPNEYIERHSENKIRTKIDEQICSVLQELQLCYAFHYTIYAVSTLVI